ncbi:hypothetical protein [Actinoplanes sp. G11-F43]|uniref:hypothetical protein n=1 Tax=Actinoplanes sp. G11-F43 TaxID=3424130 RepID=UPI003D340CE1
MFDFEGETRENDPPSSPWARIAAASGTFMAMIGLAVVALGAAGFAIVWLVGTIRS